MCENFTLTSSVMVFPVRVFTKICMAPLENFLSNTKVLKDQSCRVSFVELCECGVLKAQNYQQNSNLSQDGGGPRERGRFGVAYSFETGAPSADQYVRGEHFEEVSFPGTLGVHS